MEPSHQDLHCLPFCYLCLTEPLLARMDVSKFRNGRIHARISGVKGLILWSTLYLCFTVQPPLSPPPPNGTCDRGWNLYGSKCYYLQASQLRTVLDATLTCQQMGATLVSIHNQSENDYLTQRMSVLAHHAGSFWTNLHKSLDCKYLVSLLTPPQSELNHFTPEFL